VPDLSPSLPDLQDIGFFVEVARVASFTRASKASGIPIATLSRRISLMEKRIGVRLFQRTTRRLALTEPGRRYFERCERIMQDAAAAQEILKASAERLCGHLRLSTPVEFGLTLIAPIVDQFARQHPDITIDVDLSPRPTNFIDENIDVSIRLGEVKGSSLIVRHLGNAARLFYAAPSYLARYGIPTQPKDLADHECILQSYMAQPDIWRLISGRKFVDVDVHGRFSTNNVSMTLRLAEMGHGIAAISPAIARQAYDAGTVRHVLTDWSFPPMPVQAVMNSRLIPARVRAFVDFLANHLTVT
jgi:DNA-binding transcriptional LysR family regulator